MQIFARITKIDEATRRVYGVASSEAVDHAKESLDYDLSKQYFTDWSDGVAKATDGKSVGNLRVMHGNVVAGKLVELQCDDVTKSFPVCAEVVDDNEWKKTLAGCYTGFSIGGSYVSKAPKNEAGVVKYVAKPNELSLVDLPCNPEATFIVSKADGVEELRKFAPDADRMAKDRTDLATKIHANLAKAEPVALSIAALIGKPLEKGMCSVADLADILNRLGWVTEDAEWEADWEGDGSTVPADLRDAVKTLAGILVRMATEESQELADALSGTEKVTPTGDLHKGASQSEEDVMDAALQKSLDDTKTELAKVAGENATLTKSLADANAAIAERDELLTKAAAKITERDEQLQKFLDMPAPVKAAMRAVSKGADLDGGAPEVEQVKKADGTVDESLTAIKKALAQPVYTS